MTTYNDLATKEDRIHISNARKYLGVEKFNELAAQAKQAFKDAWNNEESEIKKPNSARRAVNLLFTRAMNEKRF